MTALTHTTIPADPAPEPGELTDEEARARHDRRKQRHRDLVARCHAILSHLPPGCAFSHVTAAALHQLPMSGAMEADTRIHVIRPLPSPQVRQPGISCHRALHTRNIVMIEGLPVVGLPDTWVDIGELIGRGKPVGLDDMIVLGDAVATRCGSTLSMQISLHRRVRPRGKLTLLEALELIRVGSRSAAETISRIMLVRVGLPEPRLNIAIISRGSPKRLLGVADLVWEYEDPNTGEMVRVVCEVQGTDYHSAPGARRRDGSRRRDFEDDGWRVEWMWGEDRKGFEARCETCLRIADALDIPGEQLALSECEPRFFAQHRLDEAAARQSTWRGRSR